MSSIASELRHRVTVQEFVESRDQFNNSTGKAWVTYKTLWGKLSGFSGKDLIHAFYFNFQTHKHYSTNESINVM